MVSSWKQFHTNTVGFASYYCLKAVEAPDLPPYSSIMCIDSSIRSGLRAITAVKEIQKNLQLASGSVWKKTILFGTFGGATVGVYVGENMLNPSVASSLFKPFMDKLAG